MSMKLCLSCTKFVAMKTYSLVETELVVYMYKTVVYKSYYAFINAGERTCKYVIRLKKVQ